MMTNHEIALATAVGSLLWAVAGLVVVVVILGLQSWELRERVDELESWRDRHSAIAQPQFIPLPQRRGR